MNPKRIFPATVRPCPIGRAVYEVQSKSRKGLWHKVDVERVECECESFVKGDSRKKMNKHGVSWNTVCHHVRMAAAAHGILCAAIFAEKE